MQETKDTAKCYPSQVHGVNIVPIKITGSCFVDAILKFIQTSKRPAIANTIWYNDWSILKK